MRSVNKLHDFPAGTPLLSDELIEFHAARLMLLLRFCGTRDKINGLTKLAKLDFFVRYPQFFDKAAAALDERARSATRVVESSMVRHHYGPWDKRYYDVLAYLEARGLVSIYKDKKTYYFELTDDGKQIANQLGESKAFGRLIEQMKRVKTTLGSKGGTALKNLIYKVFDEEVARRPMGKVIES